MADTDLAPAPTTPLSFLIARTRPHRGLLVAGLAAAAIGAVFSLAPFVAVGLVAERLLAGEGGLVPVAGFAFGAVVLQLLCMAAANWLGHSLAFAVQEDVRLAMIARLGRMPVSALDGRAATIKKTVLADADRLEGLLAHVLPDMVAGLAAFVAGTVLLAMVDWRIMLAAIALLPLAAVAQRWTYRGSADVFAEWGEAEADVNAAFLSYVRGIGTLKAFNRLASTLETMSAAVHRLRRLSELISRWARFPYALFNAALSTNLVVVFPLSLHLAQTGAIGGAELVFAVVLGARLTVPLARIVFASMVMARAGVATGRIEALLTAPIVPDTGGTAMPRDNTLALHGVRYAYPGGEAVLDEVDFTIPPGKVTALVGPSGAGKSTLARLLPRFDDVTEGRITLGGVDLRGLPLDALRARFAVVFQHPVLHEGTIRDNIAMACPEVDDARLLEVLRAARVDHLVAGDGTARVGEGGTRLSGGERQRVAIARAILKDAPILVLDEATAFVDPHNEADVQRAIGAASHGRTLVVVAHRLSTIRGADQIVVLNAGRVEACGTHADLLETSPTYRALWSAQSRAAGWSTPVPALERDAS